MIYIPTAYLKPDMVLAKDISAYGVMFALLAKGQTLTPTIIERLREAGIPGAYIKSEFSDDIEPVELLDPVYKRKVIDEMRTIFEGADHSSALSDRALEKSAALAEDLVMNILNQDVFLVDVISIKDYDNYTYSHSMYVAILSVLIGMKLNYSQKKLADLALCGLMHDIGKIDIPIKIINKPGKLTEAEYSEIKTHPLRSIERLRHNRNVSQHVFNGISCHHEKYDGTGYPYGLKGNDIHIYARILALADVYDALTSDRSYRRAWTPSEALEYMMSQSNTHFDFSLLQCFLKTVAAYPSGTIVRLSNGVIGIVVKNNAANTMRPLVRVISGNGLFQTGDELDLLNDIAYLNVIVSGTISSGEIDHLPDELTKDITFAKTKHQAIADSSIE